MKIQFCGAATSVTGSCHLITFDNNFKILLDCGLFQGNEAEVEEWNRNWFFKPSEIDGLILSHAHIDHIGRVPKLVKDGFKGNIYCTSATKDLATIMLLDSANIQENDAEYESKKQRKIIAPLYTENDVKNCLQNFVCVECNNWFDIQNNISFLLRDAGHILGSTNITLKILENNIEKFIGFSGDIGRYNRPILKDPQCMPKLDVLICESTYGGKIHEETPDNDNDFLKIIIETCVEKKGKLIIPAFSVGRTQELLYRLDAYYNLDKLPNIPVFVDSPLAMNATEVFRLHPECFDDDTYKYLLKDNNPFGWNDMNYIKTKEESIALNESNEPCIIISSSGMANAGRIRHHIFHAIENENNTILIVGYCSAGTLGEQLIKKPTTIHIFNEEKKVAAKIEVMSGLSAHADEPELLKFLDNQDTQKLQNIFLVHGETKRQTAFKNSLVNLGFKNVAIPTLGEIIEL